MDALDRVKRVRRVRRDPVWQDEDYRLAGARAKRLWQTIEELFGVQYGILTDAVSVISPEFELSRSEILSIQESEIASVCRGRQVALSFVKWDRCRATCGIDNPFGPILEIFEHGGYVDKEHGQFVDIFDHRGKRVAGLVVRRA